MADALMAELTFDGCGGVIAAPPPGMTRHSDHMPGAPVVTFAVRGRGPHHPVTRAVVCTRALTEDGRP